MTPESYADSLLHEYGLLFPDHKQELLRALLALAFSQEVVEGGVKVHQVTLTAFEDHMAKVKS